MQYHEMMITRDDTQQSRIESERRNIREKSYPLKRIAIIAIISSIVPRSFSFLGFFIQRQLSQ
jgi:hypothetical protein